MYDVKGRGWVGTERARGIGKDQEVESRRMKRMVL
jgi:hypothetical protein